MPADTEPVDNGGSTGRTGLPEDGAQTVAALRAELDRHEAESAQLRAQLAALSARLAERDQQVVEWRAKAFEYDALMRTKTMHAVRIPRAIYGRLLTYTRKED